MEMENLVSEVKSFRRSRGRSEKVYMSTDAALRKHSRKASDEFRRRVDATDGGFYFANPKEDCAVVLEALAKSVAKKAQKA